MANHNVSWVLGAHVCFGSLDFIITVGGELVRAHTAIRSLSPNGLDHERLGRQLGVSLGPQQSRENQRRLALSNDDDMARPSGEGHLSSEHHVWSAPTAFSFGLYNATVTACHFMHYAWFNRLWTASSWG